MDLEKYIQYHETEQHGQPGFSYNTYLCTIPQDFDHVDLHWHSEMEIIYVKSGSGRVTAGPDTYGVEEGCIVPVLPSELHAIYGSPGVRMEYENIIFRLSILDSRDENDWCRENVIEALNRGILRFPRPIRPGTAFHEEAAAALDAADRLCMNPEPGYQLMIKGCLFRFLYALYQNRTGSAPQRKAHQETLKAVLSYVRGHFSEKIGVEDAARVSGYSEAHFMRFFKQETGRTFGRYLLEYRLRSAACFLKETDEPVSAVAGECGFENLSYFIRQFRRYYGAPPREYRNSQLRG
ncbi:MAG: AraC family transcriptional regulator [Lachnospiraceae bacterium]|jgi:AraC-like DNA-binding protein|nr:AraC family transcriptional regulator [Lachnospiraceae bacterium]MCI1328442.1 AraC family transcriptional regulator [Lachnospiraceae bacterium]